MCELTGGHIGKPAVRTCLVTEHVVDLALQAHIAHTGFLLKSPHSNSKHILSQVSVIQLLDQRVHDPYLALFVNSNLYTTTARLKDLSSSHLSQYLTTSRDSETDSEPCCQPTRSSFRLVVRQRKGVSFSLWYICKRGGACRFGALGGRESASIFAPQLISKFLWFPGQRRDSQLCFGKGQRREDGLSITTASPQNYTP